MHAFNQQVIHEFRTNAGHVGGNFAEASLLLLHHRGAHSGTERVTPLMYRRDGDTWVVFASKAGAPTNPDWFHNLRAHPDTTIELGTETVAVSAREVTGADRDRIWNEQKRDVPQFADYEQATDRTIPVIALRPR